MLVRHFRHRYCAACDTPVCGSHSTLGARGRLCGRCDARIRVPLERAAREREEQEKAHAQIAHEPARIRRETEAVAQLEVRISELVAAVRTGRDLRAWALGPPLHQSYPSVAKGRSAMGIHHWFRLPKSEFNDWFTLVLGPGPNDGVTPLRNEALFVGEHGAVAHTRRVGHSTSARRNELIAVYKPGDTIAEDVRERFFRRNVTKLWLAAPRAI